MQREPSPPVPDWLKQPILYVVHAAEQRNADGIVTREAHPVAVFTDAQNAVDAVTRDNDLRVYVLRQNRCPINSAQQDK